MRIGIGSAQFGFDYGISNNAGQVPKKDVEQILNHARRIGMDLIDTSPYYGEAQRIIGSLRASNAFKIVSKSVAIEAPIITANNASVVRKDLLLSLKTLKKNNIYGLIVHRVTDIRKKGAQHLFNTLQAIKDDGLVEKIGVSIYTEEDAEIAMSLADLDILQAPISLFDQTLIRSGALSKFQSKNIEVHARSIFLQGALFLDPQTLPLPLSGLKSKIEKLRAISSAEGVPLHCLGINFLRSIIHVDYCIVGINTLDHLEELECCKNAVLPDMADFHLESETLRNPSLWRL
jgi:aryl-alcohol dehydrogenase-like predicted oxidoreductase